MTSGSGTRMPTWKERENNMKRERKRRAIAAKIFTGLRMYGNYKLPKHCDNNHVLMALCREAGWIVEPDGTTYRKGCKPIEYGDTVGRSATVSPLSSYHQTPVASYNPSPGSSAIPSPTSSSHAATPVADGSSQLQWLKHLSAASSSLSFPKLSHLYIPGGSMSAPVTPPLGSPTARSPQAKANCHDKSAIVCLTEKSPFYLASSTPSSPGRQILPDPKWFAGIQIPQGVPTSPTFSLVKSNPFSFHENVLADSGPLVWTPGQSGASSPCIVAENTGHIPNSGVVSDEFAFGKIGKVLVKPWEGEKIHEEPGIDDLELTLGSTRTR